jgi:tRNA threonylcarbamoyladenosine biosynthesis protein TsaE
VHVDAYRLLGGGPAPLDDLDLEAALEVGVVVVEWGEGLVEHLAASRLHVRLDREGEGRTARVRVTGSRWAVLPGSDVTT